jgi:xylulokinase
VLSGEAEPPAWSAAGSAEVFTAEATPLVREQYAAVRELTGKQ